MKATVYMLFSQWAPTSARNSSKLVLFNLLLMIGWASAIASPNTLAIDAQAFGDRGSASATTATSTFSTTKANELLLAFIATDGTRPGVTVSGIRGAGVSWSLVQRANQQLGTAEIWRAFAPSVLSRVTVTATLSQSV